VVTIRTTRGYRVFQAVNGVLLTGVVLVTLFPFVNIIARSFSAEHYIRTGEVTFWPRGVKLKN
jgi:putative aldouronate transport system permease protein